MTRIGLLLLILLPAGWVANGSTCARQCGGPSEENIEWMADGISWRNTLLEWKRLVEDECESIEVDDWYMLFKCPDFSGIRCRNDSARRYETDLSDCTFVYCEDGQYQDQRALRTLWKELSQSYREIMEVYKETLKYCPRKECEEATTTTGGPRTSTGNEISTTEADGSSSASTMIPYNNETSTQAYEDTTTTEATALGEACRGGTYISGDLYGTISSPNYPSDYPDNADCSWNISVPDGMVVTVRPGWSYDIEDGGDKCIYDYLQFNNDQRICGLNSYDASYQTTVNYLTVTFYSDEGATGGGFTFDWIASNPAAQEDTTPVAEAQTTAAGSSSTDSTVAAIEEMSTELGDYGNAVTTEYSDYSQTYDRSTPPDA